MTPRHRNKCKNYNTRKCGYNFGVPCDDCENWKEKKYTFTGGD
jgi:hypothetical protein